MRKESKEKEKEWMKEGRKGKCVAMLLCARGFPGKNTGTGCHFLFQMMDVNLTYCADHFTMYINKYQIIMLYT